MSKHTPGPWTWADEYHGLYGSGKHNAVLEWYQYEGMHLGSFSTEVDIKNAALIAAAPDLLEALKDARYALYGNGPGNPKIDAAISKAEGRE